MRRYDGIVHPKSGYGCEFFEWIHILFVAVVLAGLINGTVLHVVVVHQFSMEPTFYEGNRVCLCKCAYWFSKPKYGDVVIFCKDNNDYIKRVIGEPGDTIIIEDYKVYRNGIVIDEDYIKEPTKGYFNIVVPDGMYFCMGDNRNVSIDSRDESVGCISFDSIKGKVVWKAVPFGDITR